MKSLAISEELKTISKMPRLSTIRHQDFTNLMNRLPESHFQEPGILKVSAKSLKKPHPISFQHLVI